MKYSGPVEVDAGAILLDAPLHCEPRLAVIRRIGHADWSLPKGHLEDGETLEEAAERETLEETGYAADYLGLAGAVAYQLHDRAKTVTFFFFIRRSQSPIRTDLDGVDQVDWLTFEQACRRVSYPDLSELLARVAPQQPRATRWRQWRRARSLQIDARLDRLDTAIASYERELRGVRRRPRTIDSSMPPKPDDERLSLWWQQPADELLAFARTCSCQRRVDAGWNALRSSQRLSLYELVDDELAVSADSLRAEVKAKLDGWRKKAALKALASDMSWPPRSLFKAHELLDEHNSNVYLRLRFAGRRIATAAGLLTATILALWLATYLGAFADVDVPGPFVLRDAGLFGGVLLLGVFGSMLSLALDLSRSSPRQSHIYDLATTRIAVPVARLAIGAAAAVLTVGTAQTALVGGGEPWLYLVAIPAGFSDRLVRRSVEALESAASGS